MSSRTAHRWLTSLLIVALLVSQVSVAVGGFTRNGAVGGISINADGVVKNALVKDRAALAKELRAKLAKVDDDLQQSVVLRKISLRALEAACQHYLKDNGGQLPDEVRYLGGLQRVQYVMVYPELNDVVIAGPAEGWKVDTLGNVVGVTTGRPVLKLDDLLVALRSAHQDGNISVSIDPTEQGSRKLQALLDRQKGNRRQINVAALEAQMKEAFGPQQIKLQNVDPRSHFARVLVAADYRMKRIAMNLDKSPVAGLPSYVELIKNSRNVSNVNPRWWLACNYEPLVRNEDGTAWEIRGQGVKVMTEDEFVDQDGQVRRTGRASSAAQKWADLMTEKYDELSQKDVVFGELRNIMDLSIVAAIIQQHDLTSKAGCSLPLLTGADSDLLIDTWNAPKTVPPQCSFLRTRGGLVVTASGGVQIESWQVATTAKMDQNMGQMRQACMAPATNSWWWN